MSGADPGAHSRDTQPVPHRILITGATGFIGRHLCRHLQEREYRLRALVRSATTELPAGLELAHAAELTDRQAVRKALVGVDAVIHAAARVHVMRETAADGEAAYQRVNVEGTRCLVEEATRAGVQRFVFISSVKAVGEETSVAWTEDTVPRPRDPYGVSKMDAERIVRAAAEHDGLHAPILRLPMVYGPGNRANMLRLFELVDRGIPIPLGGIRNKRSLAYVGNVTAAVEASLRIGSMGRRTLFVSDGQDVSTPDLIRAIGRALGRRVRMMSLPESAFRLAGRVGDLLSHIASVPLTSAAVHRLFGSLVVDSSPLWCMIGEGPPFSLESGLRETASWYRSRRMTE